jgi:hypothetical protein
MDFTKITNKQNNPTQSNLNAITNNPNSAADIKKYKQALSQEYSTKIP